MSRPVFCHKSRCCPCDGPKKKHQERIKKTSYQRQPEYLSPMTSSRTGSKHNTTPQCEIQQLLDGSDGGDSLNKTLSKTFNLRLKVQRAYYLYEGNFWRKKMYEYYCATVSPKVYCVPQNMLRDFPPRSRCPSLELPALGWPCARWPCNRMDTSYGTISSSFILLWIRGSIVT